jgi:hypothetical protein
LAPYFLSLHLVLLRLLGQLLDQHLFSKRCHHRRDHYVVLSRNPHRATEAVFLSKLLKTFLGLQLMQFPAFGL